MHTTIYCTVSCDEDLRPDDGQLKRDEIFFDVLLTVHLSIILVTDQLNAQILVL